jgi:hypothetical protein
VDTDRFPEDLVTPYMAGTLCDAPLPRGEQYLGPEACPGDVGSEEACPLPLPDACLQPL